MNSYNSSLTDLGGFKPVIDETTGQITGYTTKIGGADTVFPFKSPVYLRSVLRYNSKLSDSQKFSAEVQLSTDNSTWTTVAICYAAFGSSATSDVYTYK